MYTPFRHIGSIFYKKNPIHLTFFLTKRCNSKCPFCFYLKSTPPIPLLTKGGEGRVDKKSEELSLDEIQQISRSIGNLLWLAFSGGEIYLRDDLVEISQTFYENNKPSVMLFPTNGLMPELIKEQTEKILKNCSKSIIAVKLSIDGLNSSHDSLRKTPGSFDKVMHTYKLLGDLVDRYHNFELGVNTVFCTENQDEMESIIDFVKSLAKIKTHTISLIRGNLSDEHYKNIDTSKYLHAIAKMEENLKNKTSSIYRFKGARIKAAQDILQRRIIHKTIVENRQIIPCFAGRLNLVLTEDGNLSPCEILTEAFGNVRDYGYNIQNVLASQKAREVINSIKDNKCFCTHECYLMTNILFNPRQYGALWNEYVSLK